MFCGRKGLWQEIGNRLARTRQRFVRVKHWRGFGVLAVAYVVVWSYLFIVWYNPWQNMVSLGGDWQLSFAEGIAMFFYLMPGLLILPGAFYIVWTNLLRKTRKAHT